MAPRWRHHQSGLFSLDFPADWMGEEQPTGAFVLKSPDEQVTLTLTAVSQRMGRVAAGVSGGSVTKAGMAGQNVSPSAVQAELDNITEQHREIRFAAPARLVPATAHLTSLREGVERVRAGVSWLQRMLGRGPVIAWRFWAVMNEHLLILAQVSGEPAVLEEHKGALDRAIGSILLPDRDLLVGRPFTEAVASLARNYFPRTQVAMIDDIHLKFGACQVDLVPLHRRYLEAPDELSKHVRSYFSEVQRLNDSVADVTEWEQLREYILPCLVEPERLGRYGQDCAHQEWINGLHVVYVVDEENGACRPVTSEDLDTWLVDLDELHERAIENLVARSSELTMEVSRAEGYVMLALSNTDPYNASRILLPSLNRTLREHLGQTFFVAVPSREFLLAFATTRDEVLARVRKQIVTDYKRTANPVSTKLFLATPDGVAGDPDEPDEFMV